MGILCLILTFLRGILLNRAALAAENLACGVEMNRSTLVPAVRSSRGTRLVDTPGCGHHALSQEVSGEVRGLTAGSRAAVTC